jgi:hypothetical protein
VSAQCLKGAGLCACPSFFVTPAISGRGLRSPKERVQMDPRVKPEDDEEKKSAKVGEQRKDTWLSASDEDLFNEFLAHRALAGLERPD